MKKFMSLSVRLSITILSIIFFVFLVALILHYRSSHKNILQDARHDAERISALTISQIERRLDSARAPLLFLLKYNESQPSDTSTFIRNLKLISQSDKAIMGSFGYLNHTDSTLTSEGKNLVYFKNGKKIITETPDRFIRWQRHLRKHGTPFWSEPYQNRESDYLMVAFIMPAIFQFENGQSKTGFAGFEMQLQWLGEIINAKKVFDDEMMFAVSGEGLPVYGSETDFLQHHDIFQTARRLNNPELFEVATSMTAGKKGSVEVKNLFNSQTGIVYYAPVGVANWSLAVVFPKSQVLKPLHNSALLIAFSAAIGFILILFSILSITKKHTIALQQFATAAKKIGDGDFDVELPAISYQDEVALLKDSIGNMQEDLRFHVKNLISSEKEKERTESELQLAQHIRTKLLPLNFDILKNIKNIEFAARLMPAHFSGGDFYDFFRMGEKHFCFAIGKVSVAGIAAAINMTKVLALLRSSNYVAGNPGKIMGEINKSLFHGNDKPAVASLFLGLLDVHSGEFLFCNAGHNYPYLLQENSLYEMKTNHGPAIGAEAKVIYKTGKMLLKTGDIIVAYTEGVFYGSDKNEAAQRKANFEELLIKNQTSEIKTINEKLIGGMMKQLAAKPLHDDISVISLKYLGKKGAEM